MTTDAAFNAWVDRARSTPIESFVGDLKLEPERKGDGRPCNEFVGPCPNCGGRDRFSVNTKKQTWHCRGCKPDVARDIIGLVQWWKAVDFVGACTELTGEPPPSKTNGKDRAGGNGKTIKEGEWIYRDAAGAPYLKVVRLRDPDGKKIYPQYHLEGDRWVTGRPAGPKIPYRLRELVEADSSVPVWIVEGEKCADRLAAEGVTVTTASEGAEKWTTDLNAHFRGRICRILPDANKPGRNHAIMVARNIYQLATEIRIVEMPVTEAGESITIKTADGRPYEIPSIKEDEDVFEFLGNGGTIADLETLASAAPIWELGATGEQPPPADEERAARSNGKVRPNGDAAGFAFDPQPYRFPDPASIPRRQWLHGRHYVRGVVSMTVGAPGRAKSTLDMTDVIGMASGRDLLNGTTLESGLLRAAYLNGEENAEELDRRVAAICKRHDIKPADCGDRLFVVSTRDAPIKLAVPGPRTAAVIAQDAVDALARWCEACKLDVLVLDPLISFHQVRENDSGDMDLVCKEALAKIAGNFRAVEVVHHPRKPSVGQADTTTMDDARGSGAALGAIRIGRTLNFMSATEAAQLGIDEDARRLHVRIDGGKSNPGPLEKADWLRIETELIANGEYVACVTNWRKTDPFIGITTADMMKCREVARTGEFRFDPRAGDWIGFAVADALGIDVTFRGDNEPKDMARLKGILKTWFKNKVLAIDPREDRYRKRRNFVVPGPWKPEPLPPEQMGMPF